MTPKGCLARNSGFLCSPVMRLTVSSVNSCNDAAVRMLTCTPYSDMTKFPRVATYRDALLLQRHQTSASACGHCHAIENWSHCECGSSKISSGDRGDKHDNENAKCDITDSTTIDSSTGFMFSSCRSGYFSRRSIPSSWHHCLGVWCRPTVFGCFHRGSE